MSICTRSKWFTLDTIRISLIQLLTRYLARILSRRMASIKIKMGVTPHDLKRSIYQVNQLGQHEREISVCNSAGKRSSTLREVTHFPSQRDGELLNTAKVIEALVHQMKIGSIFNCVFVGWMAQRSYVFHTRNSYLSPAFGLASMTFQN